MVNESIDKLARSLADTLPEGLRAVRADLEKNFRAVLESGIGKLDLVTREEFEVQQAVLRRTREKLETLEKKLADLAAAPAKPAAKTGGKTKKKAKKKVARKREA